MAWMLNTNTTLRKPARTHQWGIQLSKWWFVISGKEPTLQSLAENWSVGTKPIGLLSLAHTTCQQVSSQSSPFSLLYYVYSPKWTVYMHLCRFTSKMSFACESSSLTPQDSDCQSHCENWIHKTTCSMHAIPVHGPLGSY